MFPEIPKKKKDLQNPVVTKTKVSDAFDRKRKCLAGIGLVRLLIKIVDMDPEPNSTLNALEISC